MSKNPYEDRHRLMVDELASWLEIGGFQNIVREKERHGRYADVHAELPSPTGNLNIVFECKASRLQGKHIGELVNRFDSAKDERRVARLVLICPEDSSPRVISRGHEQGVEVLTLNELRRRVFNLEELFDAMEQGVKSRLRDLEKHGLSLIDVSILPQNSTESVLALEALRSWECSNARFAWIIGPGGSGKTTFLERYCHNQLCKRRDGKARSTPILIDLTGRQLFPRPDKAIIRLVQDEYEIRLPLGQKLVRLAKSMPLILVLDGLDAARDLRSSGSLSQFLFYLLSHMPLDIRFILASRGSFFYSHPDSEDISRHFTFERTRDKMGELFEVLTIDEKDFHGALSESLRKSVPTTWFSSGVASHLISRPLHAYLAAILICSKRTALFGLKDEFELIEKYVEVCNEIDTTRRTVITTSNLTEIFVRVSRWMKQLGTETIDGDGLALIAQKIVKNERISSDPGFLRQEMKGCTYFREVESGRFKFEHSRILECYAAQAYLRSFRKGEFPPPRELERLYDAGLFGFLQHKITEQGDADWIAAQLQSKEAAAQRLGIICGRLLADRFRGAIRQLFRKSREIRVKIAAAYGLLYGSHMGTEEMEDVLDFVKAHSEEHWRHEVSYFGTRDRMVAELVKRMHDESHLDRFALYSLTILYDPDLRYQSALENLQSHADKEISRLAHDTLQSLRQQSGELNEQ